MEYVGEQDGDRQVKCIYCNTLTDVHFVHDFVKGAVFEEEYESVVAKYARRIERLYELWKKSRRVLFVWMDYPVTEESISDDELQQSLAILRGVNPQTSVSLLYLRNEEGVGINDRRSVELEPGLLKMAFWYKDPHSDRHDGVQRKTLKKIFSKLKLSWRHLSVQDILRRYYIFYIKKSPKDGVASVRLFRIPIWKYTLK